MKHLLIAALSLFAAPAFAADTVTVHNASGEAAIENGNKKLAREQALQAALRDALVRGAGAQLDSATLTEGGTLVQDKIFVHANGYVKHYEIQADQEEEGAWHVKLDPVVVGMGELSKDLAAVRAEIIARGHPRLYVLVREQSVEGLTGSNPNEKGKDTPAPTLAQLSQGVVEQGLVSHLSPLGWKFVDPMVASGKVHVENALTTDFGNLNGKDFATVGADYVVLGSVVVRPEKQGSITGAGAEFVQLRAVMHVKSTDTGETIASVEKTETVKSVISQNDAASKALETAAGELAEALQKQVLETWRKNRNGVGNLHLYVTVADYEVLQAFEAQLEKAVANVKGVEEVSFNEGKADLSVNLAGTSSKQLAGSLSNKSVKGLPVKVTKVTANTVEVKLGK